MLAYRGRGEPWLECFERQAHASLDDALKSPLANHAPLGRITLATAAALRTSAKKSQKFDRRHVGEGFGIISTTRGFSFVRSYGRGKVGGKGGCGGFRESPFFPSRGPLRERQLVSRCCSRRRDLLAAPQPGLCAITKFLFSDTRTCFETKCLKLALAKRSPVWRTPRDNKPGARQPRAFRSRTAPPFVKHLAPRSQRLGVCSWKEAGFIGA